MILIYIIIYIYIQYIYTYIHISVYHYISVYVCLYIYIYITTELSIFRWIFSPKHGFHGTPQGHGVPARLGRCAKEPQEVRRNPKMRVLLVCCCCFFLKYFMCYDVYLSSNIPMKCAIDSILYISLYTLYVDITEGFHLRHVWLREGRHISRAEH